MYGISVDECIAATPVEAVTIIVFLVKGTPIFEQNSCAYKRTCLMTLDFPLPPALSMQY